MKQLVKISFISVALMCASSMPSLASTDKNLTSKNSHQFIQSCGSFNSTGTIHSDKIVGEKLIKVAGGQCVRRCRDGSVVYGIRLKNGRCFFEATCPRG